MKRLTLTLALALGACSLGACTSTDDSSEQVVTCADCGVEKGAEGCCDPDAERCDGCGKIKASAGCCK